MKNRRPAKLKIKGPLYVEYPTLIAQEQDPVQAT